VYGIYLYQSHQAENQRWTQTSTYDDFVDEMNLAAVPTVAAVMVLLTICIPRRLLSKKDLMKVAGGIIAASTAVYLLDDLVAGLTVLLTATAQSRRSPFSRHCGEPSWTTGRKDTSHTSVQPCYTSVSSCCSSTSPPYPRPTSCTSPCSGPRPRYSSPA